MCQPLDCLQDERLRFFASELTEEERASILAAPEFLEFVENSSKILQRALNDGYDYIRDYTIGTESGGYVAKLCGPTLNPLTAFIK